MELLFLGTSSGTPTKTRNMSGLALRGTGSRQWVLIDCGEGTQHRLLHTSLSLATLGAVFITHIHGDHCYGLPGLLASAGLAHRTEPLCIVGPQAVQGYVRAVMETSQLRLPFALEFTAVETQPEIELPADFRVRATALSHRVASYAYSFSEKALPPRLDAEKLKREGIPPGPLWGELEAGRDVVLADGRRVAAADHLLAPRAPLKIIVGGDNDTPALLAEEARTAQVLIHEATYTEAVLAKVGPGPQHSSALRVAQMAQEAQLGNLVLTHFSPRYQDGEGKGLSIAEIEAEARAIYRGRLFLAKDLERYQLDRSGVLHKAAQVGLPRWGRVDGGRIPCQT